MQERKDADLVLTRINPLDDIHRMAEPENILLVLAKGRQVKDLRTQVLAGSLA